jgi:hypothetical protein
MSRGSLELEGEVARRKQLITPSRVLTTAYRHNWSSLLSLVVSEKYKEEIESLYQDPRL